MKRNQSLILKTNYIDENMSFSKVKIVNEKKEVYLEILEPIRTFWNKTLQDLSQVL